MKFSNWHTMGSLTALALMFLSAPTVAQEQGQPGPDQLAESAVGKIGQRQAREQKQANIEPMARINNRVLNRVQNRIRNRIDRYYNPRANVTSPFEVAVEQTRKAGAKTPR